MLLGTAKGAKAPFLVMGATPRESDLKSRLSRICANVGTRSSSTRPRGHQARVFDGSRPHRSPEQQLTETMQRRLNPLRPTRGQN
eukprot:6175422-Pleurochrysis_carterae.AAC.1